MPRAVAVDRPSEPRCPCGQPSKLPHTFCVACLALPAADRPGVTRYAHDLDELRPLPPEDPFPGRERRDRTDERVAERAKRSEQRQRHGGIAQPLGSIRPRPTPEALAEAAATAPGVNVASIGTSEGSGPAPTIPPHWLQDGPPWYCDAPGCSYRHDGPSHIGISVHRSKIHGLPGVNRLRPGALTPSPGAPKPASAAAWAPLPTIDTAEILARLAHQWGTLGILECRFMVLADGRLALQARLVPEGS